MENIIRQIGTISRALDTVANIEFTELNLSKGQYVHVVRISERPGITLRALSLLTCIDETTCSRSINKLVANEIVYKQTSETNKRNKMLFLTEQGEKLAETIKAENDHTLRRATSNLNEEQANQLNHLLELVVRPIVEDYEYVKEYGKRDY